MARALIGNPLGRGGENPLRRRQGRAIPAGNLLLIAQGRSGQVDVAAGAEAIMKAVDGCGKLDNVAGEAGTNIGGMLEHVRQTMAELTNKPAQEIRIQDLLAVDTAVPVSVTGGLAGSSRWSRRWVSPRWSSRIACRWPSSPVKLSTNRRLRFRWAAPKRGGHSWGAHHSRHHAPAGDPRSGRRVDRRLHYQCAGRDQRHSPGRRRRYGHDDHRSRAGA